MRKQLPLLLCITLLILTGCQRPASSCGRAGETASSVPTTSAQGAENDSDVEAASDETKALIAAAEQGQAASTATYTVEDGILYCGGIEVSEEQTTFDFRESNLEDYSFLKNYGWVENLLIEDEALTNLDFLRDCTNLKSLTLTCGASDFQAIGELSQLLFLDLHSPNLTDLNFLSHLSLNFLNCSYCDGLNDISGLEGLSSLSFLGLLHCATIDDFSVLSSLPCLEQLVLSGTTFDDLTLIASLSALSNLSIEGCAVDYELFASASYSLKKLGSDADADTEAWLETIFPDCDFA